MDITDNGAGDADAASGRIVVPGGGTYGTFTFLDNVIAQSKPAVGTATEASLNLEQLFVSTSAGGTLVVTLADTDFTFPDVTTILTSHLTPFPPGALSGPAGTSITFQSWANADNLSPLPGLPTTIPAGSVSPGPLGPFGPGDPSASATTTFARGAGPYSLFSQMTIVLTGEGVSCFQGHTHLTGEAQESHAEGRMTGGGSIFTPDGIRVTHGFELHCNVNIQPNNLQINIHIPQRDRFHLESLTSVVCIDDPSIAPEPPAAPIDTYYGKGTGRLNGVSGYTIHFTLTDAGEPGVNDHAAYLIWLDSNGNDVVDGDEVPVLDVGETHLTFGNHQAHTENKSPTPTVGTWQAHANARDFPDYWPVTGLSPTQRVRSVFSRAGSAPYGSLGNDSLLTSLSYTGGSTLLDAAKTLLKAAAAAIVDASHPNVSYALTPDEIRSQVNAALASQDVATITTLAGALTEPEALRHWQIPTEPQRASGTADNAEGAPVLTEELLQPIVQEAIGRWQAAGIAGASLDALNQMQFVITDLPGEYLGLTAPSVIQIDHNAAGHGWFVDGTPGDDVEFGPTTGAALARMDLLTVVTHEFGHVLGFQLEDEQAEHVMAAVLQPGIRRMPELASQNNDETVAGNELIVADSGLSSIDSSVDLAAVVALLTTTESDTEDSWSAWNAINEAPDEPAGAPVAALTTTSGDADEATVSDIGATTEEEDPSALDVIDGLFATWENDGL